MMSEQEERKFIEDERYDFIEKYYGRRVHIKVIDDKVSDFDGKVGWFDEYDEAEEGEDMQGIIFDDVDMIGRKSRDGLSIPLSWIGSYIPLERENTPEEIAALNF